MRVKLLAKHVIGGREWPVEAVLDLPQGVAVTPLMEGLDSEATAAIAAEKRRVFTRYVGPKWAPVVLDDPPIEYPFDNPPVPLLISGEGGPPR